jgi:mono/diheme cytochrome c family protein
LPLTARDQQGESDLAAQARAVLEANCYRCHGKDGRFDHPYGSILEVKKLVERKKVVPKKSKTRNNQSQGACGAPSVHRF